MKLKLFCLFILSCLFLSSCSSYDQAYQEGYNAAIAELGTYQSGYDDGYSEGHHVGYQEGLQGQYGVNISNEITEAKPNPVSNDSYYILNTSSKKIHLPSCSSVSDMLPKNMEKSYEDIQTLIDEGYSPCGKCNP